VPDRRGRRGGRHELAGDGGEAGAFAAGGDGDELEPVRAAAAMTRSVLSPMEPVAPRRTTRLRDGSRKLDTEGRGRARRASVQEPEDEVRDRRGQQQAVGQVEGAADAGNEAGRCP